MNALIKKGAHEVAEVKFRTLLKCNVVLKDGRRTQIAVFLPDDVDAESINAGINVGLEYCGDVVVKQSALYKIGDKGLKCIVSFLETAITPLQSRHDDMIDPA